MGEIEKWNSNQIIGSASEQNRRVKEQQGGFDSFLNMNLNKFRLINRTSCMLIINTTKICPATLIPGLNSCISLPQGFG